MTDPRVEHAGCDRALGQALDRLERLRRQHSLLVGAVEQLRPFEGELLAMRHRGEPTLDRLAALVMLAISTLSYDGSPLTTEGDERISRG